MNLFMVKNKLTFIIKSRRKSSSNMTCCLHHYYIIGLVPGFPTAGAAGALFSALANSARSFSISLAIVTKLLSITLPCSKLSAKAFFSCSIAALQKQQIQYHSHTIRVREDKYEPIPNSFQLVPQTFSFCLNCWNLLQI